VQASVDEISHSEVSGKLIESNAPINLGFFTNCKAICISKDIFYTIEGLGHGGFNICIASEDRDAGGGPRGVWRLEKPCCG
jgi:hypothetical protein